MSKAVPQTMTGVLGLQNVAQPHLKSAAPTPSNFPQNSHVHHLSPLLNPDYPQELILLNEW
jgi:hypothetical protein